MEQQKQVLRGIVENITYRNDDNGYSVFEVTTQEEQVTVVGVTPFINIGEQVTVQGEYMVHPVYGPQFRADALEHTLPSTAAAVLRYLSSGAIKGIGPQTARQIVDAFGEKALQVLEHEPGRLVEIRGISPKRAEKIADEFARQFGVREVMLRLSELKITANESVRIYNKLGNSSIDKINENPYMLCSEGIGFSFERADEICSALEESVPLQYRISAGIEYILKHNLHNGHTCLPVDRLVATAAGMLGYDSDSVEIALEQLVTNGRLTRTEIDGAEFIFLPLMYRCERYCANRIALMLKVPPAEVAIHKNRLDQFENDNDIVYDEIQRTAIATALSKGIFVLTGGPGTGKTTTLNAIISLLEEAGANIALAAPTGRAAKRMSELCGKEAKTLHRLLEVEWGENDRQSFKRNEGNPLPNDVVVVDELSMMDIQLFDALLHALTVNCRLILVGDVDQLPSVGAGNVLHDIIDSGTVPVIRLEKVFRQALKSLIVTNAHKIIAGELPQSNNKDSDFFVLSKGSAEANSRLIAQLCGSRLPDAYGFSPLRDIQVLCPSRKRSCGSTSLNNVLQGVLNPAGERKREFSHKGVTFREGDKVMQIKNNYDIQWKKFDGTEGSCVYNGDIGILKSVDKHNAQLFIEFEDRLATYLGEDIDDIELAYAVTVHKSQGNEFDCVVLSVCDIPPQLSYRNLLYTAVTRAKKLLIIVGSNNDIKRMVDNNKKTKRFTSFRYFLEQANGEIQ